MGLESGAKNFAKILQIASESAQYQALHRVGEAHTSLKWASAARGNGRQGVLATADIFLFEDFRLDRQGNGLSRRNEGGVFVPVPIGLRALDILAVLVERSGNLVSKEEIMAAVWGRTVVESANLTVQISSLRRVLDEGGTEGSCIRTVAARGYRFLPTVTRVESAKPASMERPAASISQPGVAPRLSIVVLPFADLSEGGGKQYFADGITDDLTTDLSRVAGSFVIARGTAFTYKGKAAEAKQIGRELGVRYVLEGSLRRSGNQVRVNAQLIDAETDAHLWAERFDRSVRPTRRDHQPYRRCARFRAGDRGGRPTDRASRRIGLHPPGTRRIL